MTCLILMNIRPLVDVCDIDAIRCVDGRRSACIELDIVDAERSREVNAKAVQASEHHLDSTDHVPLKVLENTP